MIRILFEDLSKKPSTNAWLRVSTSVAVCSTWSLGERKIGSHAGPSVPEHGVSCMDLRSWTWIKTIRTLFETSLAHFVPQV